MSSLHSARRTWRRRALLKAGGAVAAFASLADQELEALPANVPRSSRPSALRITNIRTATVAGAPMRCAIVRIDTNQGIYGLGEVRDAAPASYALALKDQLIGQNPCDVDRLFRKIKRFGGNGRLSGGVCGVEMALWDLAGKAYGVPVYQMLGGRFRDRIRLYSDTTQTHDVDEYARRLKGRLDKGFTFLKMDLGVSLVSDEPGATTRATGGPPWASVELTDRGAHLMAEYVAAARKAIGPNVPLAADHFGSLTVESCIRLANALEPHNMAWLEDMVPWEETEALSKIAAAVNVPILTGEDIYLKEPFRRLLEAKAVDVIHPDLATAGGILETKKIGDMAQEYGVPMAMHFAGTPVSFMANVHCAAATESFLCLEDHSVDVPWWEDLVTSPAKPIVEKGYARVPEAPGLGVELNEDVVRRHLAEPGYFAP